MLRIDLTGKRAFVAGVGDDIGFGWAIAKVLAEAGAEILVGTWPPMLKIFSQGYATGKFDESRKLSNGNMLSIAKVYPLDAAFDTLDEVPEEVRNNKRYQDVGGFTISEVAQQLREDCGTVDILVHSLANAPEIQKQLHETSRKGYLAALSASSYSWVSMLNYFAPLMPQGSSALTLTYVASEQIIPGYGGGMSSAKAALECDTRVLSYEMGRKYGIRCNAISAGPYASRAARAIGFIERMAEYSRVTAPLAKAIEPIEVANAAAFLLSPLASGITGEVVHVDAGLSRMGVACDSAALAVAPSA